MKCPKTGFACNESQKYRAKMLLSDGKQIICEGVAERFGKPMLFCDKCKPMVDMDVLVTDESWLNLCETFKKNNKPIPKKNQSIIQWDPLPRLQ